MSHMVFYRGTDGTPAYHQADEVHDAVAFVESLRNEQGLEGAKIYRLEPINFEYKPYFRVELTTGDAAIASAPSTPAVEAAPAPEAAAEKTEAPAEPAPEAAAEPAPEAEAAPSVSSVRSISDAPTVSGSSAEGADNGVGARRGLFGR